MFTIRRSALVSLCGIALLPLGCRSEVKTMETRKVTYTSPVTHRQHTKETKVVTEREYRHVDDDHHEHRIIEVDVDD